MRVIGESEAEQKEGDLREIERREVAMKSITLILVVMCMSLVLGSSKTEVIFTLAIVLLINHSYTNIYLTKKKVILRYIISFLLRLRIIRILSA